MFGWRKRNDGFEWQKYVRTTIKLRREHRKARVAVAKDAAIVGLKDAGRAGAAAGVVGLAASQRGLRAAASAIWIGLQAAARHGAVAARAAATTIGIASVAAWRGAVRGIAAKLPAARRTIVTVLALPGARLALVLMGVFALVSAVAGFLVSDAGLGTIFAAALSAVVFILVLASIEGGIVMPTAVAQRLSSLQQGLPWLGRFDPRVAIAAGVAILVGVVSAVALLGTGGVPRLRGLPGLTASPSGAGGKIEGRGTAIAGDILRVGPAVVRLAGIEAPEREQRCARPGDKRWRCGESAAEALGRLVRGRSVACEPSGSDDAGRVLATCLIDSKDIAAELVRDGHVFATGILFARYGAMQNEAQAQKAGLWRGEADRPSDYRAKIWEAAKKKAPAGCPIKGQVSSDGKVYVLPWSRDYDRIKLRTTKGERYFCSEREAVAAGWKASARG